MIVAIDMGNTNIVIGVFDGRRNLKHHWRMSTNLAATADEYGMMVYSFFQHAGLNASDIDGVIMSSVVPPLTSTVEAMCRTYLQQSPLIVGPGIKTGLNIRYENPKEVGSDRIVNAVAAIELYGSPLIVVDFGTATTFDYIDEKGQYIGGAIAPGIDISTEALYARASKLPRIELVKPRSVVGRNPITSMQAGILYGYAGQVDGIVARIREEFPSVSPTVVATGGAAEWIASESKTIEIVNPLLTLEGLSMIYEINQGV